MEILLINFRCCNAVSAVRLYKKREVRMYKRPACGGDTRAGHLPGVVYRKKREQISMPKKKEKKIDLTKLKPEELMKYEIAAELGLFDKVMKDGWQSLTARETGKIGGMVTQRKKAQKENPTLTEYEV